MDTLLEVDIQTKYIESQSRPDENFYFFSYCIRIRNSTLEEVQLLGQSWMAMNERGESQEISSQFSSFRKKTLLSEGSVFEFQGNCPLNTPSGTLKGWYHFQTGNGEKVHIEVPEYYLVASEIIH